MDGAASTKMSSAANVRRKRQECRAIAQLLILALDEGTNRLRPARAAIFAKQQSVSMHRRVAMSRQQPVGIYTRLVHQGRDDVDQERGVDGAYASIEQAA